MKEARNYLDNSIQQRGTVLKLRGRRLARGRRLIEDQ